MSNQKKWKFMGVAWCDGQHISFDAYSMAGDGRYMKAGWQFDGMSLQRPIEINAKDYATARRLATRVMRGSLSNDDELKLRNAGQAHLERCAVARKERGA